jgi:hypothetical protein
LIEFNNPLHAELIARAAGANLNKEFDQCISRSEDGDLLGGTIYTDYTGRSICCHMAGFRDHWINRDLLWVTFHYPFVQLNCDKIIGFLPVANTQALEFDLKLGFKEEAIISDVYPQGSMIIVSLRREDCKWLKLRPITIAQTEYGDG